METLPAVDLIRPTTWESWAAAGQTSRNSRATTRVVRVERMGFARHHTPSLGDSQKPGNQRPGSGIRGTRSSLGDRVGGRHQSRVRLTHAPVGSALAQSDLPLDPVDDIVWRRGAGREADDVHAVEPLGSDLCLGLHVIDAGTVARAGLDQ